MTTVQMSPCPTICQETPAELHVISMIPVAWFAFWWSQMSFDLEMFLEKINFGKMKLYFRVRPIKLQKCQNN